MTEHEIEVRQHPVYDEHRPDCSCGWSGSYSCTPAEAETEGQAHVEEVDPPVCVHCGADLIEIDGIHYHARIEDWSHMPRAAS